MQNDRSHYEGIRFRRKTQVHTEAQLNSKEPFRAGGRHIAATEESRKELARPGAPRANHHHKTRAYQLCHLPPSLLAIPGLMGVAHTTHSHARSHRLLLLCELPWRSRAVLAMLMAVMKPSRQKHRRCWQCLPLAGHLIFICTNKKMTRQPTDGQDVVLRE